MGLSGQARIKAHSALLLIFFLKAKLSITYLAQQLDSDKICEFVWFFLNLQKSILFCSKCLHRASGGWKNDVALKGLDMLATGLFFTNVNNMT